MVWGCSVKRTFISCVLVLIVYTCLGYAFDFSFNGIEDDEPIKNLMNKLNSEQNKPKLEQDISEQDEYFDQSKIKPLDQEEEMPDWDEYIGEKPYYAWKNWSHFVTFQDKELRENEECIVLQPHSNSYLDYNFDIPFVPIARIEYRCSKCEIELGHIYNACKNFTTITNFTNELELFKDKVTLEVSSSKIYY